MAWLDLVILAVIVISALISLVRGFVKESISLASWILATIIALRYFEALANLMLPYLDSPTIRLGVAFAILFIATLIVGAIINFMVSQLVTKTGLSGTDKTLGVVFGGARGVLIVSLVVLMAGLTPMPNETWWKQSVSVGYFQNISVWIKELLPEDITSRLSL